MRPSINSRTTAATRAHRHQAVRVLDLFDRRREERGKLVAGSTCFDRGQVPPCDFEIGDCLRRVTRRR